jgi:hypothetical protein
MHNAQNDPESTAELAAFRQGLQQLGWSENRNIRIDIRFAADRHEPMLANAATRMPRTERLEWRQADATKLPFDDLQLFAPVARRIRFGGGIALFDRGARQESAKRRKCQHRFESGHTRRGGDQSVRFDRPACTTPVSTTARATTSISGRPDRAILTEPNRPTS